MLEIVNGPSQISKMPAHVRAWRWLPFVLAVSCATPQPAEKPVVTARSTTPVQEAPALVPFHGKQGFTVLMPPNPDQVERTQSTPGGPVYVHLAEARTESAKYLASVSDFPKGSLDRTPTKSLLDSLEQSTIQSMNGTLVGTQDIIVAGLPGREFTATDPQGSQVTARILAGDSRVYTVAGTYPTGSIPGAIRQFLDSFQPGGAALPVAGTSTEARPSVTR